jgi:beta-aspartyl-peptidase (threonine type)
VSATGTGDIFLSLAFARRVADLIELGGLSGAEAADKALAEVGVRQGEGGCVLIDAEGEVHAPQTTPHMVRGWLREGDSPQVAIAKDESIEVSID